MTDYHSDETFDIVILDRVLHMLSSSTEAPRPAPQVPCEGQHDN